MKVCVTGATGFLGGHVARLLAERRDHVRVTYRDAERLRPLRGLGLHRCRADVLDYASMRRAVRGCEILFHTVGFVGSSPAELVWRINAYAPLLAVEAAAAEGVRRVVFTSTISAVGLPRGGRPADENTVYPSDWLGLAYPDSKHEGERGAIEAGRRHGIDVVVVNPAYLLGVPVDRSQPGETSTRTVGNYLRGRLPAVVDAAMNFADVEDAAAGHLLAAEHGRPGERYILGAVNTSWPALIDRVARLSGVKHPVIVLPREIVSLARVREALGLPGPMSAEGYELMSKDWRFSSAKASRELGYEPRPLDETLRATIDWYSELMAGDTFNRSSRSALSTASEMVRGAAALGMLMPLRVGQRVTGRRTVAGI